MPARAAEAPGDASWIAAVHPGPDHKPHGTGVVISPTRVLTCAHNVTGCTDGVWLTFPKAGGPAPRRRARVEWTAGTGGDAATDVAVLRLEEPVPPGVRPADLAARPGREFTGRRWWAFGFPPGSDLGSTAYGVVGADLAGGGILLDRRSEYPVEPGFSGGGLWMPGHGVAAVVIQARNADPEGNSGDGVALTLHHVDELLRHDDDSPGGLAAIASARDGARPRRRWVIGAAAALAVGGAATAAALWPEQEPDASPVAVPSASTAGAPSQTPSTGAPRVLPASEGCSEKQLLTLRPADGATGAPPAVYVSSCLEERTSTPASRALLRVETPGATPLRATVRWRVELHNCRTGGGEITTPSGTADDPYREEAVTVAANEPPSLATNWYPFEGRWFGQGRVEKLEVTDERGGRWSGGDAFARTTC